MTKVNRLVGVGVTTTAAVLGVRCVLHLRDRHGAVLDPEVGNVRRAAAEITDETYALFELERWILAKAHETGRLEIRPIPAEPGIASRYASAVTQASAGFWLALDDFGRSLQAPAPEPGYAE